MASSRPCLTDKPACSKRDSERSRNRAAVMQVEFLLNAVAALPEDQRASYNISKLVILEQRKRGKGIAIVTKDVTDSGDPNGSTGMTNSRDN
ncbi:hypothetical protein PM082_020865 [Marasmius tenuissimus]|nr:hypothetical protein PM082_020865 [Marasmius tenuissimus]